MTFPLWCVSILCLCCTRSRKLTIKYACLCQFYSLAFYVLRKVFLCCVAQLGIFTVDLKCPQRQKSHELMSGQCADQGIPQSDSSGYRLNTFQSPNVSYRLSSTVFDVWAASSWIKCIVICTLFWAHDQTMISKVKDTAANLPYCQRVAHHGTTFHATTRVSHSVMVYV